ncbi:hypothetical protein 7712_00029 [Pseudomonas phage bmx-p2]|nr:hypothetical protein 7712_00029 [Pseudomonas phage bmx-p2]
MIGSGISSSRCRNSGRNCFTSILNEGRIAPLKSETLQTKGT